MKLFNDTYQARDGAWTLNNMVQNNMASVQQKSTCAAQFIARMFLVYLVQQICRLLQLHTGSLLNRPHCHSQYMHPLNIYRNLFVIKKIMQYCSPVSNINCYKFSCVWYISLLTGSHYSHWYWQSTVLYCSCLQQYSPKVFSVLVTRMF